MARRGGEAALKRAREKARQERQEVKREKRAARAADESAPEVNSQALMEEFARLNHRFEENQIPEQQFKIERDRILLALGIEPED